VPCRDEFPLFLTKLRQHEAAGLAIVGVLTDDPVEPARQFVADYHATWPTVIDPASTIKATYRVVARPHSWFIDRQGALRSQQIGGLTDTDFERQFALSDR
jgi:peroxiredoxin